MLICFEGLDGSGKSTALSYVKGKLHNYNVHTTFEPGGSLQFAKDMRQFIFDHVNSDLNPLTELLLFQAVRLELYSKEVLPALLSDRIVLSDRSFISSIAYQGYGLWGDPAAVTRVLEATAYTVPDRVLFFQVDIETALSRMSDDDPFKKKDRSFWQRVYDGYHKLLIESNTYGTYIIDANKDIQNVQQQLDKFLEHLHLI